jgi:hypothetical protein
VHPCAIRWPGLPRADGYVEPTIAGTSHVRRIATALYCTRHRHECARSSDERPRKWSHWRSGHAADGSAAERSTGSSWSTSLRGTLARCDCYRRSPVIASFAARSNEAPASDVGAFRAEHGGLLPDLAVNGAHSWKLILQSTIFERPRSGNAVGITDTGAASSGPGAGAFFRTNFLTLRVRPRDGILISEWMTFT